MKIMQAIFTCVLSWISASDMKSTCKKSTTPRKIDFRKRSQSRDQQDDCFSAPNHSYLTDFDFEKNLALFDKKAVFEEIENANPDCVKVVESKKPQKYRCDENVLQSGPVVLQQIKVPNNTESVQQFVTGTVNKSFCKGFVLNLSILPTHYIILLSNLNTEILFVRIVSWY